MAHKKAGGSSRNGRDSAGNIIVTQRGTKMMAGPHVYVGRTHSLHAAIDGRVKFTRRAEGRVHVSVEPIAQAAE